MSRMSDRPMPCQGVMSVILNAPTAELQLCLGRIAERFAIDLKRIHLDSVYSTPLEQLENEILYQLNKALRAKQEADRSADDICKALSAP